MFLKAYPEGSNGVMLASAGLHIDNLDFSPYSRMRWLGNFLGIRDENEASLDIEIWDMEAYSGFRDTVSIVPKATAECNFRGSVSVGNRTKTPESSWRKMKLHCFETGEPLTLQFDGDVGLPLRLAIFPCDSPVTLGGLHDGLHRLLPHLKALDEGEFEHCMEDGCLSSGDIHNCIADWCSQADFWN